jgi:hypothetical protein
MYMAFFLEKSFFFLILELRPSLLHIAGVVKRGYDFLSFASANASKTDGRQPSAPTIGLRIALRLSALAATENKPSA